MEREENEKLDVLLDQIGTRQTTLKPVQTRLEQISNTIEQLEQEVAEKQAEIEDLQKSKADPKRVAANLKSFEEIYEGLDAGDRQLLVRLMVKRIRMAPTRIELELYDHSPIIGDWSKGEKDGWFRTRLAWLPTPMSSGTTIWVTEWVEGRVPGVDEVPQLVNAIMAGMVLLREAHRRAPLGRWARVDAAAGC